MKRKKALMISGSALLLLALFYLLSRSAPSRELPETNIIDRKYNITLKQYRALYKGINFESIESRKYFSESTINSYTLKFLKFLKNKFINLGYEEHMAAVEHYLHSILEADKADEMFKLYQTFTEYNTHQYELAQKIGQPGSIEEMIAMLHDVHEDRRMFFGTETADALYGEEVKASEYDMRKMLIYNDKGMSGAEKEEKMQSLTHDMWGDDSLEDVKPWDRYTEKLKLYEDDLNKMSPEEKRDAMREFRNEFFSPEVTAQLERSDQYAEHRENRINEYHAKEEEILENSSLTTQEKDARIDALQKQMYGKYASLFKIRENYEKKFNASLKK